jgi:predicted Zn-dependent protease
MIEKHDIQQIAQKILDFSTADETEVILTVNTNALTRFANNIIHQNVAEENHSLLIRTIIGQKVGAATTNLFDDESLKRAVDTAVSIARLQKDDPELLPLPEKQMYTALPDPYEPETVEFSPMERAETVAQIVKACEPYGLTAAGAFSTGAEAMAIANSKGVFAYQKGSAATLSLTVLDKNSSGWTEAQDKNVRNIDPQKLAEIAIEKTLRSKDPIEISPGEYTVVLEPAAVSTLASFMALLGFGAQDYQEGRSFMAGKLGNKIVGDNITIVDNAYDPRLDGFSFDFEGMPKQKVVLIENGVAKNLVYDRKTAKKDSVETTGHALPQQFSSAGPLPLHAIVQGGDSSIEEMIASTEKGIYVTHFHYTNVVDPMKAIITGMTRDGTFLIEDGKIKCGIKNLRFTESILKAFSNVALLSKELTKCLVFYGQLSMLTPAMKIKHFTFSSGTEF